MTPEDEAPERHEGGPLDQETLVSVREVPDEATATLLCDFLRSQGIEATAAPVQMAWFSTLETLHHGYWGRVEVLGKDAARARALVEEYLAGTPEQGSGEETA
ncbi:MAG TPA: hypothetical protein VEU09_02340 [Candidatus Binatia bacterium]|nr:hypothetical protein [Candidatus Binatia bacterium]